MDTELNFLGVRVADWPASYRFYTDVLGMHGELDPNLGVWASLGGGWDAYRAGSRSMICELFDGGRPTSSERAWGRRQGIRPSIQVDDLDAAVAQVRARGVAFTGGVEETVWGRRIELTAPEGMSWTLSHAPGRPSNSDRARPYIGHVEIKAHDLAGQTAFYRDVIGLNLESEQQTAVVFRQGAGYPWLTLEPGGEKQASDASGTPNAIQNHPVFISFMASDIQAVAARMKDAGATLLKDIEHHDDWGGTDIIIADVDGNALQVVQYRHL